LYVLLPLALGIVWLEPGTDTEAQAFETGIDEEVLAKHDQS